MDGRRLKVTGIGRIAVRWHRPLEGTIKTLRLKRKAGRWFACFASDASEAEPQPLPATGREVGIDVGIHHLIATSDGETIENPQWYRTEQAKLRVLQRTVARRRKGGKNRHKAVERLQRQHQVIANRRADFLKKLACNLVERYDRIALEDLHITNLVRNHHLSKSILDGGWGYLRSHLAHKAAYAGRVVYLVDPAYTSKTCAVCGQRFESLTLSDRWVACGSCGASLDRDVNAALNIRNRAGACRARWGLQ